MSLAEPRKRRKNPMHSINLSAPNHWTNDDSKFGQRMLEKFGWTKGTGLGKNKQGISENIRVQHKVTPTGLGFVAHNADDWFKAGEDYSRLLSQLTEKFDQYQALSEDKDETTTIKKKSLVQNSLNSRSRVHYHKFTKGKDLTQYKMEELTCILGKGVKNDDQSMKGADMKEYFKTKRESKKLQTDKHDTSSHEDSIHIIDDTNEVDVKTKSYDYESHAIPTKKKKRESKLSKETELIPPNNCDVKKKKSKSNILINEDIDNTKESKKKKLKSLQNIPTTSENIDNCNEVHNSEHNSENELKKEFVLTQNYQNLVDLLIENSSAGKKYCKDSSSPLFEKKIKEFVDSVKKQCATTIESTETTLPGEDSMRNKPITLNPDDKNFIKDFEAQKTQVLDSIMKRQEVSKYINEKSMFIAKHGDVLFFGSNISDIKGYGDW